jgi:hypothetical protein
MKAGRELDALVAERVMGWTYKPFYNGGGEWSHNGKLVAFGGLDGGSLPKYSSSIADAWQVVEKLKADGNNVWVEWAGKVWVCGATSVFPDIEADTAPLAICKAALMVVGVEVE